MIQTITRSAFIDAFVAIRPDNFSWGGLRILFDYLEDLEESTGQQIELDVIALCCDYSEQSAEAIAAEYDLESCEPAIVLDFLHDRTIVVGMTDNGSIVYCSTF